MHALMHRMTAHADEMPRRLLGPLVPDLTGRLHGSGKVREQVPPPQLLSSASDRVIAFRTIGGYNTAGVLLSREISPDDVKT